MKYFAPLLAAGIFATALVGTAIAQADDSEIAIYGGLTVFNNPSFDSVALVEFPFILNRDQFDFYRPDSTRSQLEARVFAQVTVLDSLGMAVDSSSTYFSARVDTPEEAKAKGIRLFNQLSVLLKPGTYSAKLVAIDVVSKREGDIFYARIEVPPIDRTHLILGAVNLAYSISAMDGGHIETERALRNGYKVLINPVHVFGIEDSVMYVYGEAYNLSYDSKVRSQYQVSSYVVDDSNHVYQDFGYALREKPGTTAVIIQSYDIKGWPAGRYGLNLIITDKTNEQSDTAFLPFRIIDKSVTDISAGRPLDLTDPYDSLSLAEKLALVYYVLTPVERQTLDQLIPQGKENFMNQYWREHDSDPNTRVIENRLDMIHRFRFANKNFSTDAARSNGWFTDRGRIYMIYGPWDERDDVPTPVKGNPFEVWFYRQIEKGLLFVFEDRSGNQEPKLVHSNATGEVYNQDWQDVVKEGLYNIK